MAEPRITPNPDRYAPAARKAMSQIDGYLDVTQAPFHADPTGQRDSTAAIRQAIDAAHRQVAEQRKERNRIRAGEGRVTSANRSMPHATLFFPAGTYRVTDELVLADSIEASRYLHLIGEDRARTVIRLDDNAVGFGDPDQPKVLVNFLDFHWSNSAFCNSIEGLTIDTGAGNPGAVALRYHNNNIGYARDLTLRSSDPDGAGHTGFAMAQHLGGIALFNDIEIIGFDYGIRTASHHVNLTFERLTLRDQRVAGILNKDKSLSVRHLRSDSRAPAIVNATGAGQVVVLDSELVGGDPDQPAIDNRRGQVIVRDTAVSGYGVAIRDRGADAVSGGRIGFHATDGVFRLYDDVDPEPLRLPIKETPVVPWDDPADWAIVEGSTQLDDTAAIQAAIDSGARTVVLPQDYYWISDTIVIRGNVERIFGNYSMIHPTPELGWSHKPMFRYVDEPGGPDTVIFEQFETNWCYYPAFWTFQHDAARTLVIRDVLFGYGSGAYRNTGSGDLFLEDVCHAGGGTMRNSPAWLFRGQSVWARQFNTEAYHPHVVADDADVWIMGFKVGEYHGTYFTAQNGGRLEALGGVFNSLAKNKRHDPDRTQMLADHGELSITAVERSTERQGAPHPWIAFERRGGEERRLSSGDTPTRGDASIQEVFGVALPLFRGGLPRSGPQTTVAIETAQEGVKPITPGAPIARLHTETGGPAPGEVAIELRIDGGKPQTFTVQAEAGQAVAVVPPTAWFEAHAGEVGVQARLLSRYTYRIDPHRAEWSFTVADDRVRLETGLASHLGFDGSIRDAVNPTRKITADGIKTTPDGIHGGAAAFNGQHGVRLAWPIELPQDKHIAKQGNVNGIQFDLRRYAPAEVFMHDRFFSRTVAAWVRPETTRGTQVLFDQGKRRFGMALRLHDGRLEGGVGILGRRFTTDTELKPGRWSHVALVFNLGRIALWVNGQRASDTRVVPGYQGFTHVDYQDSSGGWGRAWDGDVFSSGSPSGFRGLLDDARIYDRALSPAEIGVLAERQ
ncbi:MAG: glycosyl hydrolase family 28-related protein [Planctomycetota bacterium]